MHFGQVELLLSRFGYDVNAIFILGSIQYFENNTIVSGTSILQPLSSDYTPLMYRYYLFGNKKFTNGLTEILPIEYTDAQNLYVITGQNNFPNISHNKNGYYSGFNDSIKYGPSGFPQQYIPTISACYFELNN